MQECSILLLNGGCLLVTLFPPALQLKAASHFRNMTRDVSFLQSYSRCQEYIQCYSNAFGLGTKEQSFVVAC